MSYLPVLRIALESIESFEEAKAYREKFHPQEPVVYNPNQLNDTPPPPAPSNSVAISPAVLFLDEGLATDETNSVENDGSDDTFYEGDDIIDGAVGVDVVDGAVGDDNVDEAAGGDADAPPDEKDPLAVVALGQTEVAAFNDIFVELDENGDDTNNSISSDINNQSENEPPAPHYSKTMKMN